MANFWELKSAPALSNPYLAGLVHTTVFKPDARITYALQYDSSTTDWRSGGADKAFRSAINTWKAVMNLEIKEWPFPLAKGDGSSATWIEKLEFGNTDNPELGRHSLPGSEQMQGFYNKQHPLWSSENNAVGGLSHVTFIHEIGHALGLDHPHGGTLFPGVAGPNDLGAGGLNQTLFTVMSYNDGYNVIGESPSFAYGWQATPAAFDIAAVQILYGANMTTAAGDTVYNLPGTNAPGTYFSCIWDAGGIDTISAQALSQACTIDLRAATLVLGDPGAGGRLSRADGIYGGFTIANNVIIENATGGEGDDKLTGNEVANVLTGGSGNDVIGGGDGADRLVGGDGNDVLAGDVGADVILAGSGNDRIAFRLDGDWIDGGAGEDTLEMDTVMDFHVRREADGFRLSLALAPHSVFVTGAEFVQTPAGKTSFDDFRTRTFDGLGYIASYADLRSAFGANKEAGRQHFLAAGEAEGRQITFDAARYAASYADLVKAFGGPSADYAKVTEHFIVAGAAEGRRGTFDWMSYLAANPFLTKSIPITATSASKHYVEIGAAAGYQTTFDALRYIASHKDLIQAFGVDAGRGTSHFVVSGYSEGRTATSFDSLRYVASYRDLLTAFGSDAVQATTHYIRFGFAEGRTSSFDALRYTATYADLSAAFRTDEVAATRHYVQAGFGEGRQVAFDPVAYFLSYSDLGAAGLGVRDAMRHWINHGRLENRAGDQWFGREQSDHRLSFGQPLAGAIERPGDRDWFEFDLQAGQSVRLTLKGAGATAGTLQNGMIRLYDARGQLIASDDDSGPGADTTLDYAAVQGGHFYAVASSAVPAGLGSYVFAADPIMG